MKRINRNTFDAVVLASLILLPSSFAVAQVPQLLNYQGRVTSGGTNFTGTGLFKFALVNGAGTASYWSHDGSSNAGGQPTTALLLPATNGLFSVLLGDPALMPTPIPSTTFTNADVRLRVWFSNGVGSLEQLTPDQRIAAVGYAMIAGTVPDGAITPAKLAPGVVTAVALAPGAITDVSISPAGINAGKIIGGDLRASRLQVGVNNLLGGVWSTITGGSNNTASADFVTVGGGNGNTGGGYLATVGGGYQNTSSGYGATVAGGEGNTASASDATVGGGYQNTSSGNEATVAGGEGNSASAIYATVGGGQFNKAFEFATTVSGGSGNAAFSRGATVGGGVGNTATNLFATVSGGIGNSASGEASVIGGGNSNSATNLYATVGGGFDNQATGLAATVSGGSLNTASGLLATVAGGNHNIASGTYSTVPGGNRNTASGGESFAAGDSAFANDDNSFVWCDGTQDCLSNGSKSFTATASNGFLFITGSSTGVQVPAGGNAWSVVSDRNVKENFQPVDARAVLAKLVQMPVTEWNLKSQAPAIRHIGPMAQDFKAAFAVGEDDRHISTSDADGVTFAAIKGLYEVVQEKDASIAKLQKQNAELEKRLAAVEQRLSKRER